MKPAETWPKNGQRKKGLVAPPTPSVTRFPPKFDAAMRRQGHSRRGKRSQSPLDADLARH